MASFVQERIRFLAAKLSGSQAVDVTHLALRARDHRYSPPPRRQTALRHYAFPSHRDAWGAAARPRKIQSSAPFKTKGLLQCPHAPPDLATDPLSTFSHSRPARRPCTILECPHLRSRHQLARHQRCENLLRRPHRHLGLRLARRHSSLSR